MDNAIEHEQWLQRRIEKCKRNGGSSTSLVERNWLRELAERTRLDMERDERQSKAVGKANSAVERQMEVQGRFRNAICRLYKGPRIVDLMPGATYVAPPEIKSDSKRFG